MQKINYNIFVAEVVSCVSPHAFEMLEKFSSMFTNKEGVSE